jgi:DNA modification methylase
MKPGRLDFCSMPHKQKMFNFAMMKATIEKIKPNPKNPRVIRDEKFTKLKKSLQDFPQMLEKRPLVVFTDVDSKFVVLGGNMRLKAAKELGMTELPIIIADDWTEEQKAEFLIKDNVGFGEWDWSELQADWDVEQLEDWGLDVPSFETDEVLEAVEDDFDATPPEQPITVLGDLYEIGVHRLLCGDSTDSDQVAKLMNGQKAELAHNDPPYGMKKEKDGVLNDNLNYNDLLNFNREWIPLQFTFLKDNGSWYCWGIDEPLMDIYSGILKPLISEQKATFRNLITWDKGHGQGQMSDGFRMYPIADEKCLFVMCGVQGFNNNADNYFEGWEPIRDYLLKSRLEMGWDIPTMKKIVGHSDLSRDHWTSKSQFNMPTREVYEKMKAEADRLRNETKNDAFKKEYDELKKEYDELKKEYDELKKEYYKTRAYFNNTHDNQNNVWHFERTGNKERKGTGEHATPKPIALCERVIKSSCPDNGIVIDFFLGSGSTMVAAHQLKRKCYGMELEPRYCDVIVNRMLKLDPTLTIKRNGEDVTDLFTKTEE